MVPDFIILEEMQRACIVIRTPYNPPLSANHTSLQRPTGSSDYLEMRRTLYPQQPYHR